MTSSRTFLSLRTHDGAVRRRTGSQGSRLAGTDAKKSRYRTSKMKERSFYKYYDMDKVNFCWEAVKTIFDVISNKSVNYKTVTFSKSRGF